MSIGLLWLGFGMYGAGHGDTLAADIFWLSGLTLSVIAWSILLASVIAGTISWRKTGRAVGWVFLGAAVLIFLTALGLWGLSR